MCLPMRRDVLLHGIALGKFDAWHNGNFHTVSMIICEGASILADYHCSSDLLEDYTPAEAISTCQERGKKLFCPNQQISFF